MNAFQAFLAFSLLAFIISSDNENTVNDDPEFTLEEKYLTLKKDVLVTWGSDSRNGNWILVFALDNLNEEDEHLEKIIDFCKKKEIKAQKVNGQLYIVLDWLDKNQQNQYIKSVHNLVTMIQKIYQNIKISELSQFILSKNALSQSNRLNSELKLYDEIKDLISKNENQAAIAQFNVCRRIALLFIDNIHDKNKMLSQEDLKTINELTKSLNKLENQLNNPNSNKDYEEIRESFAKNKKVMDDLLSPKFNNRVLSNYNSQVETIIRNSGFEFKDVMLLFFKNFRQNSYETLPKEQKNVISKIDMEYKTTIFNPMALEICMLQLHAGESKSIQPPTAKRPKPSACNEEKNPELDETSMKILKLQKQAVGLISKKYDALRLMAYLKNKKDIFFFLAYQDSSISAFISNCETKFSQFKSSKDSSEWTNSEPVGNFEMDHSKFQALMKSVLNIEKSLLLYYLLIDLESMKDGMTQIPNDMLQNALK